jgi:hypothetical protein
MSERGYHPYVMAALTAKGLTRRFGKLVAVDGLTFEVPSGGEWRVQTPSLSERRSQAPFGGRGEPARDVLKTVEP